MKIDEQRQVLFKLAHFDPSCTDRYGHILLDYLVLDALAVFGPLLQVTSTEVKENISQTFLLDYEDAEIDASLERLSKNNQASFIKAGTVQEKPRYQILEETAENIKKNIDNLKTVEEKSIELWRNQLLKQYREYSDITENIDQIVDALYIFISKMFIRHGVDSIALIYPDDSKTEKWLSEIKGSILEELPRINPFTDSILRLEIPNFLRDPDPSRQQYISSIFNSSFYWHLSQVDHSCSRLLREVTEGQKLYLDNNIIYSLVGLHGSRNFQSVHCSLELANELGYELWVTNKTIDEFHESLLWQIEEMRTPFPLPKEIARIGAEELGEDSLFATYWQEYLENSTSLEDFYTHSSNLEQLFEVLNIQTTNAFREEIEESDEFQEEVTILRSLARFANDHIIEHDAFHRIFINKIRIVPRNNFSEAIAWFLTNDTKLPFYDRVAQKGQHHLPFCLTNSQWVQLNRPLLARTENQDKLEQSFQILVTQPYIRSLLAPLSMDKAYNEVFGRMARYKNMSPQFVRNLVANKHFMLTIASESAEEAEELIDNEMVNYTNFLQAEKSELEEENLEALGTIEDLQKRVAVLEDNIGTRDASYKKEISVVSADFHKETRKSDELEIALENDRQKFLSYKQTLKNVVVFLVVFLACSLLIWLQPFILYWTWLQTHNNEVFIRLSAQFFALFALLNIILRKYSKYLVPSAMAFLVLIIKLASN